MRRTGLALVIALLPSAAWAQPEDAAPPPVVAPSPDPEAPAEKAAGNGEKAAGNDEDAPGTDVASDGDGERPPSPPRTPPPAAARPTPAPVPSPPPIPDRVHDDEADEADEAQMKWPDYFVAGLVTMGAGVGLGIGGAVVTIDGQIKDALGLGVFTTLAFGVGLPLTLLGGMDAEPEDSTLAYAGTFAATAGVMTAGLGGVIWMRREATHRRYEDLPPSPDEPDRGDPADLTTPLILVGVGAAATVGGLIAWSIGAGHRDEGGDDDETALQIRPGLGSIAVGGQF